MWRIRIGISRYEPPYRYREMSTAKFQHADQLTPFLSELLLLGNANQVGTPSKAGNRFEKLYTYQAKNMVDLAVNM